MGQIMTGLNLKVYMKWRKKPWEVDDLLYERLPMLAVRNYLDDDEGQHGPLCWTPGRSLRLGLSVCIEALKSWQAFRGPSGVAPAARKKLYERVPRIVMGLQTWLRGKEVYNIRGAIREGKVDGFVERMARAAAKVSACKRGKKPNPMLGSKVLHFFFPEFFPVWDTAWIKKTTLGLSKKGDIERNREKWGKTFGRDRHAVAAQQYAQYLDLMFNELDQIGHKDVEKLLKTVVSFSAKRNKHPSLQDVVAENLWDASPILFELCLMGRGRAKGVLKDRRNKKRK